MDGEEESVEAGGLLKKPGMASVEDVFTKILTIVIKAVVTMLVLPQMFHLSVSGARGTTVLLAPWWGHVTASTHGF